MIFYLFKFWFCPWNCPETFFHFLVWLLLGPRSRFNINIHLTFRVIKVLSVILVFQKQKYCILKTEKFHLDVKNTWRLNTTFAKGTLNIVHIYYNVDVKNTKYCPQLPQHWCEEHQILFTTNTTLMWRKPNIVRTHQNIDASNNKNCSQHWCGEHQILFAPTTSLLQITTNIVHNIDVADTRYCSQLTQHWPRQHNFGARVAASDWTTDGARDNINSHNIITPSTFTFQYKSWL